MALEEITTEMDVQKPAKTKDKQGPKKPLASMKKKYVKGVEVMDTELRSNVPVKQVKKESQDFADAMEKARKMTASEIAAKDKPKIKVMKKLGKAAGEVANKVTSAKDIDLQPMKEPEPFKAPESRKPHIMEEINLNLPKETERPRYESLAREPLVFEEQDREMRENFSKLKKDLNEKPVINEMMKLKAKSDLENKNKLRSLKKPVKMKD